MTNEIVITGAGLVTSLGLSLSETWDAILAGKCGIRQIDGFDVTGFDCRVAAQVRGFDPSEMGIHPRDARIMDTHSYLLMQCSRDAFKQAKLEDGSIPEDDIGFFAGMGMVDYKIEDLLPAAVKSLDQHGNIDYNAFFSEGYQEIYPLWPLSMLNNISFCQVAIDLKIKGENSVFTPHADSGVQAIAEAYNTVLDQKAKVALAGGVSEKVSPLSLARASLFGLLNSSGDNEATSCQPFSEDRKGTVLGEGCGVIALELRYSAEQRDCTILASIMGYGFAFGLNEGCNCPTVRAISQSMDKAIAMAGIKSSDIDVIIANADGTYAGDKNETEAIHKVFANCIEKINLFASKAALGNLLAGSSVVDTILGTHILKHGTIPEAHIYQSSGNGNIVKITEKKPLKAQPKYIMINSQSYEGQCASLIIGNS